eukprot:181971-Chlamydomonas_euryale.AAC.1
MNEQTGGRMDGWTDTRMDGRTDGQRTDGRMHGWTNRRIDRWADGWTGVAWYERVAALAVAVGWNWRDLP